VVNWDCICIFCIWLGSEDSLCYRLFLFDDDEGYLFATSDGFKLVTLRGVNCVLEMDAVQFVRISEKNFSCAIDCQNTLRFEWFLSYMGIDNREYKEN